jgi:hypothetical protein
MAGVLFVLIVFGGGMVVILSKTEIGRAIAERLRGESHTGGTDPALVEEVDRLRTEMAELQERMEFAERLLASKREAGQLGDK